MAGVLIGQCVDGDVGIFPGDVGRDCVDKTEHGAGVTSFGLIHRLAVVALAVRLVVILRDRDDGARVRRHTDDNLANLHLDVFQHLRIGQAQLCRMRRADPLAVDL